MIEADCLGRQERKKLIEENRNCKKNMGREK